MNYNTIDSCLDCWSGWWTMSPMLIEGLVPENVWFGRIIGSPLGIDFPYIETTIQSMPMSEPYNYVRPVIVLKSDVKIDNGIIGQNGTQEKPYVIK